MSPVSIMYSLRSYNAGEVGEGVLRESRCSCLGKGRCGAGRSAPVTNPRASSTGTGGRPALGRAAVGRQWRPPNGPRPGPSRATLSVTRYKSAVASNRTRTSPLPELPPGARRCSIILFPIIRPINPVPSSNRTHH